MTNKTLNEFNFNTYYNYNSYDIYNINFLFNYLIYDLEINLILKKDYLKEYKEITNNNKYKLIKLFKHYENNILFNYDKKNKILYIDQITFNNFKTKNLYKCYINIFKLNMDHINIEYLKKLISNYFNLKIIIKENDLKYTYYDFLEIEKILNLNELY